ncbi:hypothetical protein TcG_00083 [Trypanosoma cruzi]|nr:hypothetical protein TcG_00083 [Trypanosoma cruzi]
MANLRRVGNRRFHARMGRVLFFWETAAMLAAGCVWKLASHMALQKRVWPSLIALQGFRKRVYRHLRVYFGTLADFKIKSKGNASQDALAGNAAAIDGARRDCGMQAAL